MNVTLIPPPNDNCNVNNAPELNDGVPFAFDTFGATTSEADGCDIMRHIWMSLPTAGDCVVRATLTTCGSSFNTPHCDLSGLRLFSGASDLHRGYLHRRQPLSARRPNDSLLDG